MQVLRPLVTYCSQKKLCFQDPESSYFKANKIQDIKKIVLFCALGLRSALATKSLSEMGFKNVAHVDGGFDALKKSGLKVISKEKDPQEPHVDLLLLPYNCCMTCTPNSDSMIVYYPFPAVEDQN